MKVFGVVYLIQNLVNGKKYVGQTIKTVKERFNEHSWENTVISKAIRKHGKKNFRYGVIKSCASKEELDYWEKFFIAALKTKSPNGCNLTDGGEGIVGLKHTPEHNAKIAAAHKGKSPYKNLIIEIDAHRFSYSSLAKLLGIQSVSDKMHGKVRFTDEDITKLAEIFDKPAEYLMARDDGLPTMVSKLHRIPYKNLLRAIRNSEFNHTSLAKLLGFTKQTFSRKIRGQQNFTALDKAKLAEIFDKPIEYLMFKEEFL